MNTSKLNRPKVYAVTGATGNVGSAVVRELRALGHEVRPVSRQTGVAFENETAMAAAFRGAEGVFLMVPPETTADDHRRRQSELGEMAIAALQRSSVRRVVFLSSMEWRRSDDGRPVLALGDLEDRLDLSGIPERVYLRPGYFMENLLKTIPAIQKFGALGGALRPDVPMPMIAARDIGRVAAEALVEAPFSGATVRELHGPRDYTMSEAALILGRAIGRSDLRYEPVTYAQAKERMMRSGLSASYSEAIMEIVRRFNERGAAQRSPRSPTSTTLEAFAEDTFRRAFEKTKAA